MDIYLHLVTNCGWTLEEVEEYRKAVEGIKETSSKIKKEIAKYGEVEYERTELEEFDF